MPLGDFGVHWVFASGIMWDGLGLPPWPISDALHQQDDMSFYHLYLKPGFNVFAYLSMLDINFCC